MSIIAWIGIGVLTTLGLWGALGIASFMLGLNALVRAEKEVNKTFPPGSPIRKQYTMLCCMFNAGLMTQERYLAGVKELRMKAGYRPANG